jgi:hypothetical protein
MSAKATLYATTPDGHTKTRTTARAYTHARWIKFPWDDHQVIISWHASEQAAHSSPFQSSQWKSMPWGIVPVADAAPSGPLKDCPECGRPGIVHRQGCDYGRINHTGGAS